MATVVNARDLALAATSPRVVQAVRLTSRFVHPQNRVKGNATYKGPTLADIPHSNWTRADTASFTAKGSSALVLCDVQLAGATERGDTVGNTFDYTFTETDDYQAPYDEWLINTVALLTRARITLNDGSGAGSTVLFDSSATFHIASVQVPAGDAIRFSMSYAFTGLTPGTVYWAMLWLFPEIPSDAADPRGIGYRDITVQIQEAIK